MECHLHGKVFNYSQIKNIPNRNGFLDKNLYNDTQELITKNKELLFMPNAIHEMTIQEKKYDKSLYKIVLFGALQDGRKTTVVISGILPYFEVIIPETNECDIDEFNKNNTESQQTNLPKCDNSNQSDQAIHLFSQLTNLKYACPEKFEIIRGKSFKGYQKNKKMFVRFYFNKLKTRKEAMKYVEERGYETTSNDRSCYYRVVCRDYQTSFSSWIKINNYKIKSYLSIRGNVFDVNIIDYKECDDDITANAKLSKDNIMTCCWDIETYSPDGQLPKPENIEHKLFMIGMTFQWHHSNNQIFRVCLVDHHCDPRPNYLTVVCDSEKKIIKAFGKIINKLNPDIFLGFNDTDYDWPWLIKRAKHYKGVLGFLGKNLDNTVHWAEYEDDNIFNYNYKKERVKLESDMYAEGYYLSYPGYICIDVRTVFRQLYPTAEKSNLNYYLSLNKLGGKKDMPYQELFKTYAEMSEMMKIIEKKELIIADEISSRTIIKDICIAFKLIKNDYNNVIEYYCNLSNNEFDKYIKLKEKMAEIADYCVIDSQRCHELMKIRSVLMDRREVSKLSYTSVFDSFYRANGMKVRNLVIARGQKFGIRFSNISNNIEIDEGKYPGAYVYPPKKGLITSKLNIKERMENSHLEKYKEWSTVNIQEMNYYYTLIRDYGCNYNKSYEKIIEQYSENSNILKQCFIEFLKEDTGRPITGLDFSSLYPSLIMTYNLSPEYIIVNKKEAQHAYEEGHDLHKIKFIYNGKNVRGWSIKHENKLDPNTAECKFGIYPMILKELFDSRKLMKNSLHKWESEKEKIESMPKSEFDTLEIKQLYDNVCFNFEYINSKQKALKVFMNTFYGESGNKRSSFFVLQLAGAITTAGQENIKMVQKYVQSKECRVYYGDTDSLYLAMPEKCFEMLDKKYYSDEITKLEYWNEMINITFNKIKPLNSDVNRLLKEDNGTDFLKMAFEESLFPVAFLAKKKYYGIPHISIPNFNPKELFIRGLEVKKRGVSELLKKVCMEIMWNSVKLTNIYTLMDLVLNMINYIYNTKWDFNDFIMTDMFKPTKQNVKIQTFAKRMFAAGIKVKPYERFNYVIIKTNPYNYDNRGRKIPKLIGEKMEYSDRAEELGMEIDLDYYMKGSVNGQLSRLITYHDLFHVNPDDDTADSLKTADDKIYNNACKYIENYCKKYYTVYNSKGKIYQKIFRISNKLVTEKIKEYCTDDIAGLLSSNIDLDEIGKHLNFKAEQDAIKELKGYGKKYVDDLIEQTIKQKLDKTKKEIKESEIKESRVNESEIKESRVKESEIKESRVNESRVNESRVNEREVKESEEKLKKEINKIKCNKMIELQNIYFARKKNNLYETRQITFKERQNILDRQVSDNVNVISDVLMKHNDIVYNLSDEIKKALNIDNQFNKAGDIVPEFEELVMNKIDYTDISNKAEYKLVSYLNNDNILNALNKIRYIFIGMKSNYSYIHMTYSIIDYLKLCRNKKNNTALNHEFLNKELNINMEEKTKHDIDNIMLEIKKDKTDKIF
jgi:DNA polymerase elongation subunit (family B)